MKSMGFVLMHVWKMPIKFWGIVLLEGNLLKPGNRYCGLLTNDRPTTNNQPTNQPPAEELKYIRNREQQHQHPTNNMLEVWQNLAHFGSRPIGGAVEVLLTNLVNQQSSVSPIVIFL
jgi:hypothetical protein